MQSPFRVTRLLALFFALALSARAESWFSEARQIRQEADAVEPRSRTFEILPDFSFDEKSVKAGAIFKNKGQRVIIVKRAVIDVSVPVKQDGRIVLETRHREQHYNGEPNWSGHWREPWKVGYFSYAVTACYKGNAYSASFKVGRDGLIQGVQRK